MIYRAMTEAEKMKVVNDLIERLPEGSKEREMAARWACDMFCPGCSDCRQSEGATGDDESE